MARLGPLGRSRATFSATIALGAAALVGVALFDWAPQRVLFAYWVDVGLTVALSSVLVLFAARPPRPDDRTVHPVSISVPGVSDRGTWCVAEWLPPIHRRKVPFALGALVAGVVVWQTAVAMLTLYLPSSEPIRIAEHSIPVEQAFALTGDAFTPQGLAAGAGLFALRLAAARRAVSDGRATSCSGPERAETLLRELAVWFALAVFATLFFPIVSLPLLLVVDTRTVTAVGLTVIVVAGSLTIELASRRDRRGMRSRLSRWVTAERSGEP